MRVLCGLLLIILCLPGCKEDNKKPKRIRVSDLSEGQAKGLIVDCFLKVLAEQEAFSDEKKGRTEPISDKSVANYRARVSSRSYSSLEQRMRHFKRHKALNLQYSFWGSVRNHQGQYFRYVITRSCKIKNGDIVGTIKGPMIKLAGNS
ncbi:hypothetical protein [Pleionea sp. CnH1-48]|uniref:hypothetical protein n=1 Tax=Pleionea sp. CnH1-48 TaxID=2954494 RepID=UPI0020985DBC|nr:hypothetical protein [Pleionea sp. CnH1-48]MCO7227284.1 hypothetical protein [Pleionea sp. CnH1-48]